MHRLRDARVAGRSICQALARATLAIGIGGCSYLPAAAPTVTELTGSTPAEQGRADYFILDLTPDVARLLLTYERPGLASSLRESVYRPTLALRVGDSVSVTIFETGNPLFGMATPPTAAGPDLTLSSGHAATIPTQIVDIDGCIQLPYAGRIKVSGLTPTQAAHTIEHALAGKASQPQVMVSPVATEQNVVTVGGDVASPGIVQLDLRGQRLLDVIAATGGARFEPFETDVQLIRGRTNVQTSLQRILQEPSENIIVEPGDRVFLSHDPRSFSVLGSALKVSQYFFPTPNVTLAEAVAQSGGPADATGDVSGVFLFRLEPKSLVQQLVAKSDPREPQVSAAPDSSVFPIVYRLDLRKADGYFVAQATQVRDKDVILVANAETVQLEKLLGVVEGFTRIYYDLKRTTNGG